MLVTDDVVFVHIPKTGGTFVQNVLRKHLPVEDYLPAGQTPYRDLPAQWRRHSSGPVR